MYKKVSIVLFVLCAFGLQGTRLQAAVISFDPGAQSVGLGDPAMVDLRVSGLGDDILTGFEISVSFDDSILDFQSFDFGTGLDLFGLGINLEDVVPGGNIVTVAELSFDLDADLMIFQDNDFVLGTFTFDTLSVGTSPLDVSFASLSGEYDFFGVPKELGAVSQPGSITVTAPAVIPVPAAIWLFGSGIIGLIGFSKRREILSGDRKTS